MFHLTAHAFFKALLFLGAGSVIIALHHEQDIWKMGGLRQKMPVTFWTFLFGMLALCGVPPFSGFYSKDSILAQAWHTHYYPLFAVAAFVAVLTTFYMFRLFFVAFVGEPKTKEASHAHESPGVMIWPLRLLAVFALVGGFIGISNIILKHYFDSGLIKFTPLSYRTWETYVSDDPSSPYWLNYFNGLLDSGLRFLFKIPMMHKILEPFLDSPAASFIGLGAVTIGFILARSLYRNAASDPLPAKLGGFATAMKNRFYFDEFYEATFIRAHDFIAAVMDWIDRWLVDWAGIGLVRGGTDITGRALRLVQTGNLQTYAFLFALGVAVVLYFVLGK
jgi:NADH-quinone oxidoreductase subunit L